MFDELFEYSNLNPTNDEKSYTLLFTVLTYDTFTRDEILGQVQFSVGSVELIEEFEAMERTFTREITPRHVQVKGMPSEPEICMIDGVVALLLVVKSILRSNIDLDVISTIGKYIDLHPSQSVEFASAGSNANAQ